MRRRTFLKQIAMGGMVVATTTLPAHCALAHDALDGRSLGLVADENIDQSSVLAVALRQASKENRALALPPGPMVVGDVELPENCRIIGTPGASRLVHNGGRYLLRAQGRKIMQLSGITFDGANQTFGEEAAGLLTLLDCPGLSIDTCRFINSAGLGLYLQSCGGRIERCVIEDISGWAGLFSVNAAGLAIADNVVRNCANGGILVHRWEAGDDGTIIESNRVSRIGAAEGGTGQWGNGINLHRANNVQIRGNHISDCAFSAIRANSASNALIASNTCLKSGEVAIYAEFSFSGSVINGNLIDDAATGISIANFNEGGRLVVCNDNLVRNMRMDGPYVEAGNDFGVGIYAEADTSVANNVVEGAPLYGIEIGFGSYQRNVLATGNIVRDAGIGMTASVASGAGSAMLTHNRLSKIAGAAIVGTDHREIVTADLSGSGAGRHSHLTIKDNSVG